MEFVSKIEAMAPHASEGVYMDRDEDDRVQAAYGDRYDRLVALKNEWDPTNLLRTNHNTVPTV